jgi:methionyl-tRNA formyltransferase
MNRIKYKVQKVLFLGANKSETSLIEILESRGCVVTHTNKKNIDTEGYDLVISFGYRYIISNEIISKSPPIINLHISFLPYNKGAHPNFWSHLDGTPSGVTIHLIDKGVDTGPYLFQEEVNFDINTITFRESYEILKNKIEIMFIKNLELILNLEYELHAYKTKGTYHSLSDIPNGVDWNNIISKYVQNH